MRSTIHIEIFERTLLVIQGFHPPSDASQTRLLKHLRECSQEFDALLVYSPGGTPNIEQRKEIVAELNVLNVPVAMLTSSRLARGSLTAVSWFVKTPLRPFLPHEIDRAIAFIGCSGNTRALREKMKALTEQKRPDVEA